MKLRVAVTAEANGAWNWRVMGGEGAVARGAAASRPAAFASARFTAGAVAALGRIGRGLTRT